MFAYKKKTSQKTKLCSHIGTLCAISHQSLTIKVKGGKAKTITPLAPDTTPQTNPTTQPPMPTACSFSTTKRNQKSPLGVVPMHCANILGDFDKASGLRNFISSSIVVIHGTVHSAVSFVFLLST